MALPSLIQPMAPTSRVGRYPKHNFQVHSKAFTAQPFMLAPVLPGETLSNLYLESRVVTDPVHNPLIGWKKEYYFFYVRVTDLLTDAIRDMFVDPTNSDLTATLGTPYNQHYYHAGGGINYMERCLAAVVGHYFRDEGEPWNKYLDSKLGFPMVQIKDTFWMDSLTDKDLMPQGPEIASATNAGDLDRLMDAFEQLRALGISNMTYEDFLRSYGISVPKKDENKPELIHRFSDFAYPANTINPADGKPTSALSWVFKNGAREPKFFKEPGFIIGVSVARPKLYFAGLAGSMAEFMGRAWDWMPGYLAQMPETSLKKFNVDGGPLGNREEASDAYWADMRDLLLYGDQYQNMNYHGMYVDLGKLNLVPLPNASTFNTKNPSTEMIDQLYVKADGRVKQDGMVSLTIKGSQQDYTRGNFAEV